MATSTVVESKGVKDYSVAELRRFILEVGRTNATLQTDNEPSITALARAVSTFTGLSLRRAPLYSHQSQGHIERYHQSLWGQAKVLKEVIKKHYKYDLKVTHPLMTWLVKHATWLYNRYQLHGDGKTSYERRWGRSYQRPIVTFAETVAFKYAATTKNKTTPDWDYGIWLGKCTQSDDCLLYTSPSPRD